jgi:RHS repeat-associated protein
MPSLRTKADCDPVSHHPSVGSPSFTPDEFGVGVVTIGYSFPGTASHFDRYLELLLDGVVWGFLYPQQISGTWTVDLNVSCRLSGSHTLEARATACGESDSKSASFNVNTKPTVSIATSGPADTGAIEIDVEYQFPNTGAPLQRHLQLFRDGLQMASTSAPSQTGTWHVTSNSNCEAEWRVVATSCTGETDEDSETAEQRKPTVSLALRKVGLDGNGKPIIEATVDYSLRNPNGVVDVVLESWIDADGQSYPGSLVAHFDIPGNPPSDRKIFTFTPPSLAQQVSLKATATTACGSTSQPASIDCMSCLDSSANPVYYSDGNMRLTDAESLPRVGGHMMTRTYNSDEQIVAMFGRGWTTLFDRRIVAQSNGVAVTTATGGVVHFANTGNGFVQTWPTARRELDRLVYDSGTGEYRYRPAGSTEVTTFRGSDGRIESIRDLAHPGGATMTYDTAGRPAAFTDDVTGIAWVFGYDGTSRQVSTVTVPGQTGLVWTYQYGTDGNLSTVLAPGSLTWRTYEYSGDRMTASRDALGHLIETHSYDANGFATDSTGDVDEIQSIEYGAAGSGPGVTITRVTYKTGAVAEYTLQAVGNAWRTVHVSGGCGSCGARDATYVYDSRGRTVRVQAADGYVTESVYSGDHLAYESRWLKPVGCDPQSDAGHCRMDVDALAVVTLEATSASVTLQYEHADSNWPDRVTAVERPSVRNLGQIRRDQTAYHAVTGAVVSSSVCGWDGGTSCTTRTTTTTMYQSAETAAFDPGGVFQAAWLSLAQPLYQVKSIDGPRTDVQDVTTFVYYPIDPGVPALLRGHVAATKNAAGHVTRYEDYDVFGNLKRSIDPNGVATETAFDLLGRPVSTIIKGVSGCDTTLDPICGTDITSSRAYYDAGPLKDEQRPEGEGVRYTYDDRGRVTVLSRGLYADPTGNERISTAYDPATGKKSAESLERLVTPNGFPPTWQTDKQESFTYDSLSRLSSITHADGTAIHYTYDPADRVATVRDENHGEANTTYKYDPAGRVSMVQQTLAGAPDGFITTNYSYDTDGNLKSVTDPNGNVTTYQYDDFGEMTQQTSPVTGVTSYVYDLGGNLTSFTDANQATTVRQYDTLGRPTSAVSTRGVASETVTWSYDDGSPFGIGRMGTMTDPFGTTAYQYTRTGRLASEQTEPVGGGALTLKLQYDKSGNRTLVKPQPGIAVVYTYDYAGRPLSATQTNGTQYVTSAEYAAFGPLKKLVFGNGTTQAMTYDSRYIMDTNTLSDGATTIAAYDYVHDAAGNITEIHDLVTPGYDRNFTYDGLNRLTGSTTGSELWRSSTYAYDAMGNMMSMSQGVENDEPEPMVRRGGLFTPRAESVLKMTTAFTYVPNGATTTSRIATVIEQGLERPVTYDDAGNELRSGLVRTYSPRNLLSTVVEESVEAQTPARLEYGYDGRGIRRLARGWGVNAPTPGEVYSTYSPELRLLVQTTALFGSGTTRSIVWFGDRPVGQATTVAIAQPAKASAFNETIGPNWTFADHLGTPLLLTNASHAVVWQAEYEPYGNIHEMRVGTRFDQPLRFPGQEVAMNLEGTEENYNIFRWYRSGWGRYTQADPIGLRGGANLFQYAGANPNVNSDRTGLCKCGLSTEPQYMVAGRAAPRVVSQGTLFTWDAIFLSDATHAPACCEVRQQVQWSWYTSSVHGPGEGLTPPMFHAPENRPNTWYEDRDMNDKRYGRRSGVHSSPQTWDHYSQDRYHGEDQPSGNAPGLQAIYRIIVVDVCNEEEIIFRSRTIRVDF